MSSAFFSWRWVTLPAACLLVSCGLSCGGARATGGSGGISDARSADRAFDAGRVVEALAFFERDCRAGERRSCYEFSGKSIGMHPEVAGRLALAPRLLKLCTEFPETDRRPGICADFGSALTRSPDGQHCNGVDLPAGQCWDHDFERALDADGRVYVYKSLVVPPRVNISAGGEALKRMLEIGCRGDIRNSCAELTSNFGGDFDDDKVTAADERRKSREREAADEDRDQRYAQTRERRDQQREETSAKEERERAIGQLQAGLTGRSVTSSGAHTIVTKGGPGATEAQPPGNADVTTPVVIYAKVECSACLTIGSDPSVPQQAKRYCDGIDLINAALVKYNVALADPKTTPAQAAEYKKNAPARRQEAVEMCGNVGKLKSNSKVAPR